MPCKVMQCYQRRKWMVVRK